MWYLPRMPKILHVYFGGNTLSYLRYMTVKSFSQLNPSWEIKYYYPKYPHKINSWVSFEQKYEIVGDDYFPYLPDIPYIELIPVDFSKYGISNNISEVFKSDFLRWYLLSTVGGLWADMDILFFKPMESLSFNVKKNIMTDTVVSIGEYGHSIGFMMASKNNFYYKYLWDRAKSIWDPENYQSVGSILSNKFFPTLEAIKEIFPTLNPINLPMDIVYGYNALYIKDIYKPIVGRGRFTDNSIGLHWYAGHSLAGKFLKETNGGKEVTRFNSTSVLGQTLAAVVSESLPQTINKILEDNSEVLDLGCGDKSLAKSLRGKVTTLDIWDKFTPDIVWDLNNTPLPFKDNSFDTILLVDVIEHLDKDKGKKLIAEAKRIVRKNIILLTPLFWTDNLENMNNISSTYYGNEHEKHLSLWTREDFKEWREIKENTFIGDYYVGVWAND